MAKKKKAEEGDEEAKGGKNKKIIIVVLLVLGLFGVKTFVMKPKVLTPEEKAEAVAEAEQNRSVFCSIINDHELADEKSKSEHDENEKDAAPTTSTTAPAPQTGPILQMEAVTVNLADQNEKHYLKLGIALRLANGMLIEEAEANHIGAPALDKAIDLFSTKTMDELEGSKERAKLRAELGYELCTEEDSEITTVFFTDFVMQ